jgi:DnaJ domain
MDKNDAKARAVRLKYSNGIKGSEGMSTIISEKQSPRSHVYSCVDEGCSMSVGGSCCCHKGRERRRKSEEGKSMYWNVLNEADERRRKEALRAMASTMHASTVLEFREDEVLNPYSVLKIRKDATKAEIRQAYRRHALLHHPGRTGTRSELGKSEQERRERVFTVLAACCETLLERESRARLDSILKGPRGGSNTAPTNTTIEKRHGITALPFLDLAQTESSDSDTDDGHVDSPGSNWCPWSSTSYSQERPSGQNNKVRQRRSRRHLQTKSSDSTDGPDNIHYTKDETERLFGGNLALMYRARMFRPFSDPSKIFDQVFGSNVFLSTIDENNNCTTPQCATPVRNDSKTTYIGSPHSPAAKTKLSATSTATQPRSPSWTGTFEALPDGITVYITCRIVNGRKLTKRETIAVDPVTGKKKSTITVTSKDLPYYADERDAGTNERTVSSNNVKREDSEADFFDCIGYWDCCRPMDLFSKVDYTTQVA